MISINELWGQRHYISCDLMSELYSNDLKSSSTISNDAFRFAKAKLNVVHQELIDEGLIAA